MKLPASALRCLAAILDLAQRGETVTIRRLMTRLGYNSPSSVAQAGNGPLAILEQAGLITRGHKVNDTHHAAAAIRPTCRMELMPAAVGRKSWRDDAA